MITFRCLLMDGIARYFENVYIIVVRLKYLVAYLEAYFHESFRVYHLIAELVFEVLFQRLIFRISILVDREGS